MIAADAPAKVNLTLHVTGRRADGYHLLDSLVVFAGIADRLTFAPSDARSLQVTGPFAAGVPTGPDNLIWQVADLIDPDGRAAITLDKRLPHGAGLGGGSADAAAALSALSRLWGRPVPSGRDVLSLGADVPVCRHGGPVRMQGIGEVLTAFAGGPDRCAAAALASIGLVLVNPGVPVPTRRVFAGLATADNPPMSDPAGQDLLDWLACQRNDLEAPARRVAPVIDEVLGALAAQPGCRVARMSGSGATCLGLFDKAGAARDAAARLARRTPGWWVRAAPILAGVQASRATT